MALNTLRRGRIGFIFQDFNLLEELTVAENVELALTYTDVSRQERRERVAAILEKLGVGHRARHRPSQLSGGQQQRVAIARALVARPALLLADEPTGNLDTGHGDEVMRLLRQINDEGTTVVMVTHSLEHAAQAGRIVRLLDGRIDAAAAAADDAVLAEVAP
jgi:putative ABC transport system ATP-binding protein